MTSACCCGTTRMALAMTMTTTMNSASVTIPEPISITSSTVNARRTSELLRGVRTAIRKDQHRAAHRCDIHGLGLRNGGCGELRIPSAPPVSDPRGSLRAPGLDLHHLPDVETLLRRRSRSQVALPSLEQH